MRIIRPADAAPAYTIAAEAFRDLWKAVTGETIQIGTEWADEPCVLIGADDVLPAADALLRGGAVDSLGIRYGTDDYCIRSAKREGQDVLLLAGGRGRSTIYAVYDYFTRAVFLSNMRPLDSVYSRILTSALNENVQSVPDAFYVH